MLYLLLAVCLIGHVALAVAVINRLHATALPYWLLKACDALWYLFLLAGPVALLLWSCGAFATDTAIVSRFQPLGVAYLAVCAAAAAALVPSWARRALTRHQTPRLRSNHTRQVDVAAELPDSPSGTALTRLLAYVPGNQIHQLHIHHRRVCLPRLSPELEGLSIAHLSDLHFTGQLTPSFHKRVVEHANDLDADLVAITGDIIDNPRCLPWLRDVLGRLRSRAGVFFVLGNHDARLGDEQAVRRALTSVGHIDLGGQWVKIDVRGCPIVLAGNELPWFVPAADLRGCPSGGALNSPLRILLAHTPDQIEWARVHDFDLMLAGHTHGGQIQLPGFGAVLSPSRYGVEYAEGTFYEHPTLMHVSRGISGTRQLRLNCPPELTKLILTCDRD